MSPVTEPDPSDATQQPAAPPTPGAIAAAEHADLHDLKRRLHLVREVSHTVIYLFDLDTGLVDWVSRHLATNLGYHPEEVAALGSSFLTHLMHPDDLPRVSGLLGRWATQPDGAILESEYRLRHKDGAWRHFLGRDTIYTRHPDGRPHQLLGTTVDVTSRRELQRQTNRVQRLDAVAKMAGGIALDFNNLLTVVLGNVALARTALHHGADPSLHLDELQRVAEQAAAISRQLLGFAKMHPTFPEPVDLNAFLRANEALLTHLTAATDATGVAPHLELQLGDVWPIRIDPTQLTQLLVALVTNTDESRGQILIKSDRLRVEANAGALAPGRWVRLTVSDDGAGLPTDLVAKAFTPSPPSALNDPDPSLGLATVYGIVRHYHGSLDIWSKLGEGTRIEVCFPALEDVVAEPKAPVPPRNPQAGALVIVAEDEPMVAELTRRILVHAGHRVLLCPDGLDAIDAIRKHQDEVALVISDIVMPRLSGLELAKLLAAEFPDLPLLLASGYPEDERRLNDPTLAEVGFLPKPFRATDLLQSVSQLLVHHAQRGAAAKISLSA